MKNDLLSLLFVLFILPFSLSAQTVSTFASGVDIDDGLAFDAAGNLYGSNYAGSDVFKRTTDGIVSSFAGGFDTPNGLAFDSHGVLYMADNEGDRIYKIHPDGTVEVFVDNFFNPSGLIFETDSDTLIATSYLGNKVFKIAPDGTQQEYAPGFNYNGPVGTCYDAAGNLYIANFNNRFIFKVDPQGVRTFFAQPGPSGGVGFIACAGDYIYATLINDNTIYRIDLDGNSELFLGGSAGNMDGDATVATFRGPNGIIASPTGDSLFVSEFANKAVRLITNLDGTTAISQARAAAFQYTIAPNPISDKGSIQFELAAPQLVNATIVDQTGRVLQEVIPATKLAEGVHNWPFAVSELSTGIYYCKLELGQKQQLIKKIIVAR